MEMEVAIDLDPAVIVDQLSVFSTPRGAKWIDCQFKLFEELPAGALKNQQKTVQEKTKQLRFEIVKESLSVAERYGICHRWFFLKTR